jgi:hypothetical protein
MGRAMSGQPGVRSSFLRPNVMVLKMFCLVDLLFSRQMVFDFELEEGKKKIILADLNELVYTELIVSIYDKTSSGKVSFDLVK